MCSDKSPDRLSTRSRLSLQQEMRACQCHYFGVGLSRDDVIGTV